MAGPRPPEADEFAPERILGPARSDTFDIPIYDFNGLDEGPAEFDWDNLPPDLQALLAGDAGSSLASNVTGGSGSIPSDVQSLLARSRAASSRESSRPVREGAKMAAAVLGGPVPELEPDLRLNFGLLRRSNTLATGLPLAVQRSARKIEREAPAVARLNSVSGSAPSSLQASLTASGRLAALANRAMAGLRFGPRDGTATAQETLGTNDDYIDTILQKTLQDEDVEHLLRQTGDGFRSPTAAGMHMLQPPRGLANLGNTCFVNAAIQALGHCTPLTAYLLQGLFFVDLNEANPLGTGCVLTMVFAALLHELFALRPTTAFRGSPSTSFSDWGSSPAAQESGMGAEPSSSSGSLVSVAAGIPGVREAGEGCHAGMPPVYEVLPPFPPFDFLLALAQFHPFLATGEMHDAQELLAWLLDALNEDLNRARRRSSVPGAGPVVVGSPLTAREEERYAAEAWCEHLRSNRSVIVDLFQGQLRSQLRCPECGIRSLTFDPFLHLTLPLPAQTDNLRMEEAVRLLCCEEALDSDNLWECPGCSRRVLARKKLDLWKLPPVMMVHLKRFKWSEDPFNGDFRAHKMDCWVSLDGEQIDLKALVAPEAPQKEPLRYDLIAVVDHWGTDVEAGHYTACCRRPDGWWCFDDGRAYPLPPGSPVVGRQNYVLFLERRCAPTEPSAIAEQRASAPHSWPHLIDMDWSFLTGSYSEA